MAQPVIVYNASSGSDTAASGMGPSTAITGSSATNGAGNVVDLDGTPDLSGVAVGDVFWASVAGANRNLSKITNVNDGADQVTTENLLALTTGESWAIGGKRQTLQANTSRRDWEDMSAAWELQLEAGTYTITAAIALPDGDITDGRTKVRSSNPGVVQPIIQTSGSFIPGYAPTGADFILFQGVKFSHTGATSDTAWARNGSAAGHHVFDQCEWDLSGWSAFWDCPASLTLHLNDCEAFGADVSAGAGILFSGGSAINAHFNNVSLHDFLGDGINGNANDLILGIEDVLVYDCGGDGVDLDGTVDGTGIRISISGLLCERNTGDGLSMNGTATGLDQRIMIRRSVFSENGGYGVDASASIATVIATNEFNHYFSNTSGARNNLAAGRGDTSGDPLFTSVTDGSEDYTPASGSPLIDADTSQRTA